MDMERENVKNFKPYVVYINGVKTYLFRVGKSKTFRQIKKITNSFEPSEFVFCFFDRTHIRSGQLFCDLFDVFEYLYEIDKLFRSKYRVFLYECINGKQLFYNIYLDENFDPIISNVPCENMSFEKSDESIKTKIRHRIEEYLHDFFMSLESSFDIDKPVLVQLKVKTGSEIFKYNFDANMKPEWIEKAGLTF